MPRSYLHDRVRVERLKIDGPEGGPMRRMNEKGELSQITNGEWPAFKHLVVWTLDTPKTGATRGHHFHTNKVERAYLIQGEIEVLVQPNDQMLPGMMVPMVAGERIIIDHGMAHCYRSKGDVPAIVMEMGENPYDPMDTTPFGGFPK
ncbi:MAG: cupin domain-containing protein [Planctomycetota bacterium]